MIASRRLPAALLGLILAATPAAGSPAIGSLRPSVRLRDAWDRTTEMEDFAGRPLLLLYEDRSSTGQNKALKDELSTLATGDAYRDRVGLVAVADVADYDFWPARHFVKEAIQAEARRLHTDIFCDWNGIVRTSIGLQRGISTVVLYDKDGRLVFAYEGALPREKREELLHLLHQQLER